MQLSQGSGTAYQFNQCSSSDINLMQNNTIVGKTIAEKLYNSANTIFSDYERGTKELSFVKELSQRSYYDSYIALFYTAIFFAFVSQIASAISSYTFFNEVLSIKLSGLFLMVVTVIILILIEVLKYVLLNKSFSEVFSITGNSKSIGLLIVALALSVVSITASVLGGGKLGIDGVKVSNTESKYDAEIATIRNEIEAIRQRNSWKGQTYLSGKEKALMHAKEAELAKVKQSKETALSLVQTENEVNENIYRYGFGVFEAIFLLGTCYVWYFKKRVAIEYMAEVETASVQGTGIGINTASVGTASVVQEQKQVQIEVPRQAQRIGFQVPFLDEQVKKELFTPNPTASVITPSVVTPDVSELGNGNRICQNCQSVFTYKIHNQKFCCEACRIGAWEQRTGKRIKKGVKK